MFIPTIVYIVILRTVKSSLVQYSRLRYIDKEYLISFSFFTSNPWTQVCKSSNLNVGTKETELAELQVIVFYDLTLKRLTVSSFIFFIGATLRTRSHEFCFIESISRKKLLTRSLMLTDGNFNKTLFLLLLVPIFMGKLQRQDIFLRNGID